METHHPSFNCPLCRTYANLDEDVEVEIEEESVEADAVLPASLATPIIPESSRERDAGAETEVEQDNGTSRLGQSLRRRQGTLPTNDIVDLTEDVDEEMEDAKPLPALPEDMDDDVAIESQSQQRDSSASPVSLPPNTSNRSAEFLFEADGEASGSGEADVVVSDVSGNGEAVVNGKRKR